MEHILAQFELHISLSRSVHLKLECALSISYWDLRVNLAGKKATSKNFKNLWYGFICSQRPIPVDFYNILPIKLLFAHHGLLSCWKYKENLVHLNVHNSFHDHVNVGKVFLGYIVYFQYSLLITWVTSESVHGSWVR